MSQASSTASNSDSYTRTAAPQPPWLALGALVVVVVALVLFARK